MAVSVLIKEKALFKRDYTLEDILTDALSFGVPDENYRLQRGKKGEWTVVFRRARIGRGFEVRTGKGEIELNMPLPSTESDILYFYEYVTGLCELLKTDFFYRDGHKVHAADRSGWAESDIRASEAALRDIRNRVESGQMESFYVMGAVNPICLGRRELEVIDGNPKRFEALLDMLQKKDVFYASPKVYRKEDSGLIGVFTLTEDIPTVLPYVPTIFLNTTMVVEQWYARFVADTGKGYNTLGQIPYRDLVANCTKEDVYDTDHFVTRLGAAEMKDLVGRFGRRI